METSWNSQFELSGISKKIGVFVRLGNFDAFL
jgi:hypothetical protein